MKFLTKATKVVRKLNVGQGRFLHLSVLTECGGRNGFDSRSIAEGAEIPFRI